MRSHVDVRSGDGDDRGASQPTPACGAQPPGPQTGDCDGVCTNRIKVGFVVRLSSELRNRPASRGCRVPCGSDSSPLSCIADLYISASRYEREHRYSRPLLGSSCSYESCCESERFVWGSNKPFGHRRGRQIGRRGSVEGTSVASATPKHTYGPCHNCPPFGCRSGQPPWERLAQMPY